MSNTATVHAIPPASHPASRYLGPAHVLGVGGPIVEVSLPHEPPERSHAARMALAFPYHPRVGDTLLVVGEGPDFYVIGVIDGAGDAELTFNSAAVISARGKLRLTSDEALEIAAPEVSVRTHKLRHWAETAVTRCNTLVHEVRSLLSQHTRRSETVVTESAVTRARNAAIVTDETMSINGKQIHLG